MRPSGVVAEPPPNAASWLLYLHQTLACTEPPLLQLLLLNCCRRQLPYAVLLVALHHPAAMLLLAVHPSHTTSALAQVSIRAQHQQQNAGHAAAAAASLTVADVAANGFHHVAVAQCCVPDVHMSAAAVKGCASCIAPHGVAADVCCTWPTAPPAPLLRTHRGILVSSAADRVRLDQL